MAARCLPGWAQWCGCASRISRALAASQAWVCALISLHLRASRFTSRYWLPRPVGRIGRPARLPQVLLLRRRHDPWPDPQRLRPPCPARHQHRPWLRSLLVEKRLTHSMSSARLARPRSLTSRRVSTVIFRTARVEQERAPGRSLRRRHRSTTWRPIHRSWPLPIRHGPSPSTSARMPARQSLRMGRKQPRWIRARPRACATNWRGSLLTSLRSAKSSPRRLPIFPRRRRQRRARLLVAPAPARSSSRRDRAGSTRPWTCRMVSARLRWKPRQSTPKKCRLRQMQPRSGHQRLPQPSLSVRCSRMQSPSRRTSPSTRPRNQQGRARNWSWLASWQQGWLLLESIS